MCPLKVKHSKKLVGQDDHSNIFNYKYTTVVEIVPVRRPGHTTHIPPRSSPLTRPPVL
jgi:hypothetical protein